MPNSFGKPLQEATNEELMQWVNTNAPQFAVLPSDELTRRALKKLDDTMEINNQKTDVFNSRMFWLTAILCFLTLILVAKDLNVL